MGAQRTSMKDVLAAINAQNETLTALVSAIAGTQTQASTPVSAPAPAQVAQAETREIDVPQSYFDTMDRKIQKLVKDDGQERVLYARQNQRGETKLAYCLKARYDAGLKDKGFLGVVHIYG